MAVVTITCPECHGMFPVAPSVITAVRCGTAALYSLRCLHCRRYVSTFGPPAMLARLSGAGVRVAVVEQERGDGPAISADDEIAFGLEMQALPNGRT